MNFIYFSVLISILTLIKADDMSDYTEIPNLYNNTMLQAIIVKASSYIKDTLSTRDLQVMRIFYRNVNDTADLFLWYIMINEDKTYTLNKLNYTYINNTLAEEEKENEIILNTFNKFQKQNSFNYHSKYFIPIRNKLQTYLSQHSTMWRFINSIEGYDEKYYIIKGVAIYLNNFIFLAQQNDDETFTILDYYRK